MKINIKRQSQPKSTFKGLVPCSTTLNFGQSTPIFTKELVPNTQITIDVKNFVRTAVMALPTFGDYKLLTHAVFVPYASLYKPFDSFLSATKYNTGSPYIPTQVPVLQPMTLLSALEVDNYAGCIHLIKQVVNGVQIPDDSTPWQVVPHTETASINNYFKTSFVGNPQNYTSDYNVPDFILGSHYDSNKTTRYAITFSEQAKYLMRILNGLGYSFSDTGYLSALPLLAITKSMFDIFSPQQTDTENTPFESTYLYRLIMSKMIGANGYVLTKDDLIELFKMLLDNTYYINDDFIALHSLNTTTTQSEALNLISSNSASTNQTIKSSSQDLQTNFSNSDVVTSDRLKSIFRIGSLIKANTQIAGRLKEFMRSRFGSSVGDNHDSIIVKTLLTDIEVSDIFATASTSGETSSILGEYGGRAIGKGDGLIKFDSNCFGIFMVICTIIQRRHYFSGINPDLLHRQKDEFYNPIFDSLGYSMSPKAILNGGRNCVIDNTISTSFGFKPRYLEYKFFKPIVAGDFNRPSQRNTLDAFIGSAYPNNTLSPVYSKNINKPAFRAQLYNYNHIFYEHEDIKVIGDDVNSPYYTAIPDPFIVHTLLNITMHSPMISVGDSFETNEHGKNTIAVDKA